MYNRKKQVSISEGCVQKIQEQVCDRLQGTLASIQARDIVQ